jgi:hypothetical protein
LKPGHQIAQSGHAISQFILDHHGLAQRWNNQYLISLSVNSEEKLIKLLEKFKDIGVPVSYFTEPDLGDELTSICFIETEETKKHTTRLQLSLNNIN